MLPIRLSTLWPPLSAALDGPTPDFDELLPFQGDPPPRPTLWRTLLYLSPPARIRQLLGPPGELCLKCRVASLRRTLPRQCSWPTASDSRPHGQQLGLYIIDCQARNQLWRTLANSRYFGELCIVKRAVAI